MVSLYGIPENRRLLLANTLICHPPVAVVYSTYLTRYRDRSLFDDHHFSIKSIPPNSVVFFFYPLGYSITFSGAPTVESRVNLKRLVIWHRWYFERVKCGIYGKITEINGEKNSGIRHECASNEIDITFVRLFRRHSKKKKK